MKIGSVVGVLFLVSAGSTQLGNLLGLDLESVYGNLETIENAFGKTLTRKLIEAATEVYAGKFTPSRVLKLLEELTSEEKDGAANGIVNLVKELEQIVSAPGVRDQIRMAFDLMPIIMRQIVNSTPQPSEATKQSEDNLEDEELKKMDEVVVKLKQNDTVEQTDDVDTDEVRSMLGNLMGSGKVPDEFLEVMEQLLNLADEYEDAETLDDRIALDDKSTSKLSEIKDKLDKIKDKVEEGGANKQEETTAENAEDSGKDEL